ncbi:MAG TPA: type II secretion system F family protein [archaeon]|nr:type II secretion system F family protein [archaeon]
MPGLDDLRKKVEEKTKEKKKEKEPETVDIDQVEKIVERMKKKYREEGVEMEQVGGKLGELRGIIAEGEQAKVNIQRVEDLNEFQNPMVKQLGKIYLLFRLPLEPISNLLKKFPVASDIRYYLYSANMKYSLNQWLAISLAAAFLSGLFVFAVLAAVTYLLKINLAFSIVLGGASGFFALVIMLLIPRSYAQRRGDAISVELPFALRHMATELKAGIGLYKTIQTIATSDYGPLSEEFSRTINEIEEGTDTKDALRHFALRTQSKALRSALFHIIRAMKTGGNLSEIMNTIAEDVTFDMHVRIRDFAEKMNFFGVIYIFIAIVMPVFIGIIGSITNAPISVGSVALAPLAIVGIYLLGMPLILGFLVMYIKMIQPRV